MVPTLTGLITIVLGIWCQFGDYRRILISLFALTLFEASNAADLVALGGSSVTPSKLFLAFVMLRVLSMRGGWAALLAELSPRRVLFIYLILIVWAASSALLLPRLFEGTINVFSLSRADIDESLAGPLRPASGNITQSVYAIGSFCLALAACVFGRKPGAYMAVLNGLMLASGLDIFFAVADLVTAATHTGFLLDAIHTGSYTFLTADESGGMKRISGSFSEASAFATFSLELLAINVALFTSRVRPRLTGTYSVVLAVFLFLSTSSTAYVGLAVLGMAFALWAIYALLRHGEARPVKIVGAALVAGVFLGCVLFLAMPSMVLSIWQIIDVNILQKGQTDSALERGALNTQALANFFDTYGLGAGVGSVRASDFILVLASNLGVLGLLLFGLLIVTLVCLRPRPDLAGDDVKVVNAAKVGMLATLVPATLISTIFDLGPLFYILVGVIASSAVRRRAKAPDLSREPTIRSPLGARAAGA